VNHPKLTTPLLNVRHSARMTGEDALLVHYTHSPSLLAILEDDMERLDRDLAGLRMALQAIRSRGEDPVSR
jgi:hypothetical protein